MVRHHPQWHAVRAHIRAGDIGTLHFMQVPFSYFNADAANIRNQAALGGGALYDIGCYAITAGRIEIEIPFNAPEAEPCRSMNAGLATERCTAWRCAWRCAWWSRRC